MKPNGTLIVLCSKSKQKRQEKCKTLIASTYNNVFGIAFLCVHTCTYVCGECVSISM